MIIDLPETFFQKDRNGIMEVYIENGILKLRADVSFKKLMREITYKKKGNKQCFYCGRKISSDQINVDHMIPQDVGGPTIPNNLVPSCNKCNNTKSNMTLEQYLEYLAKKTAKERKEFSMHAQQEIEKMKFMKDFSFLNGWVSQMNVEEIHWKKRDDRDYRGNKYNRIEEFYQKYGRLRKAIVVDRNHNLLGGYVSLMFAMNNQIEIVPVIVLENVEIFCSYGKK